MYCVGICDDDPVFIEYIKRLLTEICTTIEFFEYLSGEELILDMSKRERYDLLILDIFMSGMDGNETARKFRKQFPDTVLVFCSGVCKPTVESFETTPYRYWLKEYTEEKMKAEAEVVFDKVRKTKIAPYVIAKKENELVKLPVNKILYIAIIRTGSLIYCENTKEKYTSSKKLGEMYEILKDFGFVYAHNSYIVNMKQVVMVNQKELEFLTGERLTIARSKAKEFRKVFAIEVAGKYEGEELYERSK